MSYRNVTRGGPTERAMTTRSMHRKFRDIWLPTAKAGKTLQSVESVRPFLLYLLNQLTSEPDFCMRAGHVGLKITAVCWTTIYCGVLQVLTDGHSSRFPL